MVQPLKIAIPMAGLGTRMRPHTWSKPKPLIPLAGKTVLDYVLEQFNSLPDPDNVEYVFIVGPQSEKIEAHMQACYPEKTVHYVTQQEMRGQSHALYQARQYLTGPMLMAFADSLIDTDVSFLKDVSCDGVAWVKPVPDPRRFGVAETDAQGWVRRLVEKPQDMSNNLALAGLYYFRSGEALMGAIEEQMRRDIRLKDEYFLADAINIYLESGAKIQAREIAVWLDAGTIETLLETNRYLLENGRGNSNEECLHSGVVVIPPVYIHPQAQLYRCVVGPNVSIGADCRLEDTLISNSILADGVEINKMILSDSLIGEQTHLRGQVTQINLGDHSWMK